MDPYSYVAGNPETETDPTGQRNIEITEGGGASEVGDTSDLGSFDIPPLALPPPGPILVGTLICGILCGAIVIIWGAFHSGQSSSSSSSSNARGYRQFAVNSSMLQQESSDPFVGHEDFPVPTPMSPTTTTSSSPAPGPAGSSASGSAVGSGAGGPPKKPPTAVAAPPPPGGNCGGPINNRGDPYPRMIDPRTGGGGPFPFW